MGVLKYDIIQNMRDKDTKKQLEKKKNDNNQDDGD